MKKILEFNYTLSDCQLWVDTGKKIIQETGRVIIPETFGYHTLGHAIRQLLADKYGYDIPCVCRPLDENIFKEAEILGLHN